MQRLAAQLTGVLDQVGAAAPRSARGSLLSWQRDRCSPWTLRWSSPRSWPRHALCSPDRVRSLSAAWPPQTWIAWSRLCRTRCARLGVLGRADAWLCLQLFLACQADLKQKLGLLHGRLAPDAGNAAQLQSIEKVRPTATPNGGMHA